MRLSARPITVYNSPNSFNVGNQWIVRAGDTNTLYFQVVDLDQGPTNSIGNIYYGNIPTTPLSGNIGLRYLVGLGVTSPDTYGINVTFPALDPTKQITIAATQVSASDASLWQVVLPSAVQPGGGNVIFQVNEAAISRTFSVINMLAVEFANNEGCC